MYGQIHCTRPTVPHYTTSNNVYINDTTLHHSLTKLQQSNTVTDKNTFNISSSKTPPISPPLTNTSRSRHRSTDYLSKSFYMIIHIHFTSPRFIALRHPNLKNQLVHAHQLLTDEQFIDTSLHLGPPHISHIQPTTLPPKRNITTTITPCRHPRCSTCHIHLNCSPTFKYNFPCNKTIYHIRHNFTCKSTNVVYLITCSKCKKQYVGYTTQQLSTQINHHRTCIINKQATYIHKHFNLPDHAITNLTIQPIDTTTNTINVQQELLHIERFWINTLRTLTQYGLNSI